MTKHNNRGIAHIYLILLIIIVVAIGFTGYRAVSIKQNKPSSASSPPSVISLHIESSPAGINISGSPFCDSLLLHHLTPYSCTKTGNQLRTVMVAPSQITVKGQSYTFSTWDGCSASNVNKSICLVSVQEGTRTIKATYTMSSTIASATPKVAPAPIPQSLPAKPPLSDCSNTPDSTGIVTCKTMVSQVPFVFALTISYPQDSQGHQYFADVVSNPYIYCSPSSACDTINEPPNVLPNIVGPMNQPGTMFMNLLSQAQTSNGMKIVFDHWSAVYDPNRYPGTDPAQHPVYFVTAYYVLAPS